jgi:multiple sugar transport system substrate-binding protein
MKRLLLLGLAMTLSVLLFACDNTNGDPDNAPVYTITFRTNGGTLMDPIERTENLRLILPTNPTRIGYTFAGWYIDAALTMPLPDQVTITSDMTLYAKWDEEIVEPPESGPGIVDVLDALPGYNISITFWTSLTSLAKEEMESLVFTFEAMYPNISIQLVNRHGADELRLDLEEGATNGTLPTLFLAPIEDILVAMALAEEHGEDSILPLDDFILDDTFGLEMEEFLQPFREENLQYDSGYYHSIPFTRTTDLLIYNQTVLEASGIELPTTDFLTWADIAQWENASCDHRVNFDRPAHLFLTSSLMFDAPHTNPEGVPQVDSEATRTMLTTLADYFATDVFVLPSQYGATYGAYALKAGDVCLNVTNMTAWPSHIPDDGTVVGFAPIPQADPDHPVVPAYGTNLAISESASAAQRLAAWLFISFLVDTNVQTDWTVATNAIPVRQSVLDSAVYQHLIHIDDTEDSFYYKAQLHRAVYAMIPYLAYEPAFVGPYTSENLYDESATLIQDIADGVLVEDALQAFLQRLALYE